MLEFCCFFKVRTPQNAHSQDKFNVIETHEQTNKKKCAEFIGTSICKIDWIGMDWHDDAKAFKVDMLLLSL